jgi:hypothetical protein
MLCNSAAGSTMTWPIDSSACTSMNGTVDYGAKGREAVQRLLSEGAAAGLVPDPGEIDFL